MTSETEFVSAGQLPLFLCDLFKVNNSILGHIRHIANNSLFINIATILFCLEIEPSKNAPPDIERSHNTGLVVYVQQLLILQRNKWF